MGVPESLAGASVRGGLSFVLARGSSDVLRLLSVLALARLLTPSDFGVVAMVAAVIGISEVLQDFGFSMASVQRSELTERQASTLLWINVASALVLTGTVIALAPSIASLIRVPDADGLVRLLAPTFILSAVASQHTAMLQRSLRFSTLARIRVTKAVVYAVFAVGMAALDFGRASLVWGALLSGAIETTMAVHAAPLRITRPRFEPAIREIARLGGGLLGYSLLTYVAGAIPLLAIGRSHGAAATGLYGRANRLVGLSTGFLIAPIGSVGLPVLARLADQPTRWRRYYYEAQSLLALPILFIAPFLMVHAAVVVEVAFGPEWVDAAPVAAASAVTLLASLPCTPTGWALVSLGRGDRLLKWGAVAWPIAIVAALVGVSEGAVGVAVGLAIASSAMVVPCLAYSFRDTSLSVGGALRACSGPVPAAIAAVAASALAAAALGEAPPIVELVAVSLVHVAVYVTILLLNTTERARARSVLDRLVRRQGIAPA